MIHSPTFVALLREGALAAEMLGTGATTLRVADTAKIGLFSLSFFCLSIGMERAAKLALVLDHCIEHAGVFPGDADLRKYQHKVDTLFIAVSEMNERRFCLNSRPLVPNDEIHRAIITVLSEFASATRYRNLDFIVKGKAATMKSPEVAWYDTVGDLILKKHYTAKQRAKDHATASALNNLMGDWTSVLHLGPDSNTLTNIKDSMIHGRRNLIIQKHAQFYVLQLIRYLAETLAGLQGEAQRAGINDIPYFSELFSYFYNDDTYFKSRKTWTDRR